MSAIELTDTIVGHGSWVHGHELGEIGGRLWAGNAERGHEVLAPDLAVPTEAPCDVVGSSFLTPTHLRLAALIASQKRQSQTCWSYCS